MCRSIVTVGDEESNTVKAEFHLELFYKETKPKIAQMILLYRAVCTQGCSVPGLGTTSVERSVQLSEGL